MDSGDLGRQPASTQQVEQWSEASESLATTLKTKLAKRVGGDEEQLSESVGEAIRWFLDRENTLETLRGTFPELHEALTFLNGTLVSNIVLDTSEPSTDTIDYVATDTDGLTATSTRTVLIEAAATTSATSMQ